MPRRSTGCALCRKRKVKCDETRPNCRRCINYGAACPGYRDVDQTSEGSTGPAAAHYSSNPLPQSSQYLDVPGRVDPSSQSRWLPGPGQSANDALQTGYDALRQGRRNELFATVLGQFLPTERELASISDLPYTNRRPALPTLKPLDAIASEAWAEFNSNIDQLAVRDGRIIYDRPGPSTVVDRLQKDGLIGTMAVISLCQISRNMARIHEATQRGLAPGAADLQQQSQSSAWKHDACLSWGIFHNLRYLAISMGLWKRTALHFADPTQLQGTADAAKIDALVALQDLAVQVPGVLQRIDVVLSGAVCTVADVGGLCLEMCQMRNGLNDWLVWRHYGLRRSQYSIENTNDLGSFLPTAADASSAIAYQFPDANACAQYQLHWILCLVIDFAFLRISWKLHASDPFFNLQASQLCDRGEEQLGHDAYNAAADFCRSLLYYRNAEITSIDGPRSFLLAIVHDFFHQCGYVREAEWSSNFRRLLDTTKRAGGNQVIDAQLLELCSVSSLDSVSDSSRASSVSFPTRDTSSVRAATSSRPTLQSHMRTSVSANDLNMLDPNESGFGGFAGRSDPGFPVGTAIEGQAAESWQWHGAQSWYGEQLNPGGEQGISYYDQHGAPQMHIPTTMSDPDDLGWQGMHDQSSHYPP